MERVKNIIFTQYLYKIFIYILFSVASSPVSKMSQKGNLTGLPRNVRDLIAEFYTQMQTWETAYLEGTLVITKMTALKLFDGSQRKTKLDPKLQELCDSLELVLQQLVIYLKNRKLKNETKYLF